MQLPGRCAGATETVSSEVGAASRPTPTWWITVADATVQLAFRAVSARVSFDQVVENRVFR